MSIARLVLAKYGQDRQGKTVPEIAAEFSAKPGTVHAAFRRAGIRLGHHGPGKRTVTTKSQAIRDKYGHGLQSKSVREIAKEFGVKPETVYRSFRLVGGVRSLKQKLSPEKSQIPRKRKPRINPTSAAHRIRAKYGDDRLGKSYQEIGSEFGVSWSAAHRALNPRQRHSHWPDGTEFYFCDACHRYVLAKPVKDLCEHLKETLYGVHFWENPEYLEDTNAGAREQLTDTHSPEPNNPASDALQ
jgi:transposase-like protein